MRNDYGYRELADAVVLQAVNDYRRAVNRLLCKASDAKAHHDIHEIEAFFRSGWFQVLCDLDGEELLRKSVIGMEVMQ